MPNPLIQFRADSKIQEEATSICQRLGLSLSSYLKMCLNRLVIENGVPFSMRVNDAMTQKGLRAMYEAGEISKNVGTSEMSLKDINAEIAKARSKKQQ